MRVIAANAGRYPVSAQCRILGVPRSTYYWMRDHPADDKGADPLTEAVVRAFNEGRRAYGTRRIKAKLRARGIRTSRRRIARIMAQNGLMSAYSVKKMRRTAAKPNEADLPNVLNRNFDGYAPHTHIASDLTYVRVKGQWCYVCLLIDLYNREIVGHAASDRKDARLVKAAFACVPFALSEIECFHTDRGSEFDNREIDELLEAFGIARSLSRKSNPWDNAVVESTNRHIKAEWLEGVRYRSLEHLQRELSDCVWWWNNERLHGTLGNMSPRAFREAGLSL